MTPVPPSKPTNAIAAQPLIRLPMMRLSVWLLAAALGVSAVAALAVGVLRGEPIARAGGLAALSVLIGTGAGLAFLGAFGPRPAFTCASLIIGASVIRMGAALALATAVYLSQRPEIAPFWTAFLAASLAVLALEVILVRPALMAPAPVESPVP